MQKDIVQMCEMINENASQFVVNELIEIYHDAESAEVRLKALEMLWDVVQQA